LSVLLRTNWTTVKTLYQLETTGPERAASGDADDVSGSLSQKAVR